DSEAESFAQGFLHYDSSARLQGVDERGIVTAGQDENALIATSAERFVDLFAFGIIGGKVAEQHQCRVHFFAGTLERFKDADWIFPRIEARDLHHEWQ